LRATSHLAGARLLFALALLFAFTISVNLSDVSAAPARATVATHFVWTATNASLSGDTTFIDNSATNHKPSAILFVTPNADSNGSCGCMNDTAPVGVWYDAVEEKWGVFQEDQSAMVAGESFNLLVVPKSSASVFVHSATPSLTAHDFTDFSSHLANGNPKANIQVTQVWNPGGKPGVFNSHPVGVYYLRTLKRWAIFNEDQAGMTPNGSFNVMIGTRQSHGGTAVLQRTTASNRFKVACYISNPRTNGNPKNVVFETPIYNPGGTKSGTYDPVPTGVLYDAPQEAVFNEDEGVFMPLKAAFNLLIYSN